MAADDSDILGGLPTNKKKKIISEVEELYARNVLLEEKNKELMDEIEKEQN